MNTLSTFHAALLLLATLFHVVHSTAITLDENNNDDDNRNDEYLWPVDSELSSSLTRGQDENKVRILRFLSLHCSFA